MLTMNEKSNVIGFTLICRSSTGQEKSKELVTQTWNHIKNMAGFIVGNFHMHQIIEFMRSS